MLRIPAAITNVYELTLTTTTKSIKTTLSNENKENDDNTSENTNAPTNQEFRVNELPQELLTVCAGFLTEWEYKSFERVNSLFYVAANQANSNLHCQVYDGCLPDSVSCVPTVHVYNIQEDDEEEDQLILSLNPHIERLVFHNVAPLSIKNVGALKQFVIRE
eukprot:687393_1